MNCKNCQTELSQEQNFCPNCGGKIVRERLSFKKMRREVISNLFGWDSKYFVTVRGLILQPKTVLQSYIDGVRKRYVNPFAFFAIGAAIALLVFNQFSEHYLSMSANMSKGQFSLVEDAVGQDSIKQNMDSTSVKQPKKLTDVERKQMEINDKVQRFILQYFNLFSFLILPIYSWIAFRVFKDPYNYGEHLVINASLQGITFLTTTTLFLMSLVVSPSIYFMSVVITIGYYCYAYGKLYEYGLSEILMKLLKFIGILFLVLLALLLLGIIVGIVIAYVMKALG